ncbi:hypothetical protein DEU56DRAFT_905527 [Suillus clintonianus]|uniref:uncharacterized protein n=1 Tax=Suillus clintonianus TaxID=1904413 RepID=UPI001B8677C8|nr:uncharacterized protein DEU56DRAFT_905527 [Suillus clintonianus]KAG2111466.1 hypothetical protein DEU56DRAFT_905527 [Suillus clintonianus]
MGLLRPKTTTKHLHHPQYMRPLLIITRLPLAVAKTWTRRPGAVILALVSWSWKPRQMQPKPILKRQRCTCLHADHFASIHVPRRIVNPCSHHVSRRLRTPKAVVLALDIQPTTPAPTMHVPHRFRFLLLCRAFVVHVRQTRPNSPALAKRMLVKFPALIHSNGPGTPSAPNTMDTTHRTSNPDSLNSPEAPSTNLPELPNSPDLAFERLNAFIRTVIHSWNLLAAVRQISAWSWPLEVWWVKEALGQRHAPGPSPPVQHVESLEATSTISSSISSGSETWEFFSAEGLSGDGTSVGSGGYGGLRGDLKKVFHELETGIVMWREALVDDGSKGQPSIVMPSSPRTTRKTRQ